MTKGTKNNVYPEGCIYELFAYTPKMSIYPNNSDMNELSEMPAVALRKVFKYEYIYINTGK